MRNSQHVIAHLANLLALAVIVIVFLLLLSVLASAFVPRAWLNNPSLAEFCIGQRMVSSGGQSLPWLRGIWLSAPPRIANPQLEYNAPGTLCGLLPWFLGEKGFWYWEIRKSRPNESQNLLIVAETTRHQARYSQILDALAPV